MIYQLRFTVSSDVALTEHFRRLKTFGNNIIFNQRKHPRLEFHHSIMKAAIDAAMIYSGSLKFVQLIYLVVVYDAVGSQAFIFIAIYIPQTDDHIVALGYKSGSILFETGINLSVTVGIDYLIKLRGIKITLNRI